MNYFILPFKDDLPVRRFKKSLDDFLEPFYTYLHKNLNINFEILIIQENTPDNNHFNLGRTINIGFDIIKNKVKDDDFFFYHPIDLLPIDTNYNISNTTKFCFKDYKSNPPFVVKSQPIIDGNYYYKSIGFLVKHFKAVNGFSNDFLGWGCEDDEMFVRLDCNNIKIDCRVNDYKKLTHDGSNKFDFRKSNDIAKKAFETKSPVGGLNTLQYIFLESYCVKEKIVKYLIR